jgi:aryl-alcohol dehydrogenase-like predicted oxidoreductase
VYSNGLSEEILGKQSRTPSEDVLISTKTTFRLGTGPNDGDGRHHLIQPCEGCAPPGHDYIDATYHLHLRRASCRRVLSTLHHLVEAVGALHRLLKFFRLAFDEVSCRFRSLRLG